MEPLIKTTRVLHIDNVEHDVAWFDNQDSDIMSWSDLTQVCLPIRDYRDLGEPSTITVTIERGDTLNSERAPGAL